MNDRVGDACWYAHDGMWFRATLRQWSFEAFGKDQGGGSRPVAIIEDLHTQRVKAVELYRICFAEEAPLG